jgi:peptide methionine sulfoxide reductase MsrA
LNLGIIHGGGCFWGIQALYLILFHFPFFRG